MRLTALCGVQKPYKTAEPLLRDAAPQGNIKLQGTSFAGVLPEDLPSIICESEAEWQRRGAWQPCLPVMHDPMRYAELYTTPRPEDSLLWKWLEYKSTVEPASIPPSPKPLSTATGMLSAAEPVPTTSANSSK
jgi:hypothetical protein